MSGQLETRRPPALTAYAIVVYVFLYFPIIVLVVYSFNGSGVGGFPPSSWTFDWYRQLIADAALWDAVWNSLIVAALAVAISLGLGLPAALALDRAQFPGKAIFRRLVLLPLILPGCKNSIARRKRPRSTWAQITGLHFGALHCPIFVFQ